MNSIPRTVLVVDDSKVAQAAIATALEAAGYRVVCTENPLLVPSLLRTETPGLALVDYEMPAVTGDMVTQIIRPPGRPYNDDIGVFLYSSRPDAELATLSDRCGADGYLTKTEDTSRVVALVDRWFRRRRR